MRCPWRVHCFGRPAADAPRQFILALRRSRRLVARSRDLHAIHTRCRSLSSSRRVLPDRRRRALEAGGRRAAAQRSSSDETAGLKGGTAGARGSRRSWRRSRGLSGRRARHPQAQRGRRREERRPSGPGRHSRTRCGTGVHLAGHDRRPIVVQDVEGADWWRLTPDAFGSYVNGTWSSSPHARRLRAGRLRVSRAAGRSPDRGRGRVHRALRRAYGDDDGCNLTTLSPNAWTAVTPPAGYSCIGDSSSVVLPDGRFLLATCWGRTTRSSIRRRSPGPPLQLEQGGQRPRRGLDASAERQRPHHRTR